VARFFPSDSLVFRTFQKSIGARASARTRRGGLHYFLVRW
jgi:hypothetical protein